MQIYYLFLCFLAICTLGSLSACEIYSPETQIKKSKTDKREIAFKRLSNGLKVVLVSDPDTDKAAASLDVHIGHLADPIEREGLTHFVEHMLFLGTEAYPKVGEYEQFVKANGGYTNASTSMEHSSYFFQIDNAHLDPALDRFSQFFIAPLFSANYVEKEKNAVHSEFSLKVKDAARRYNEAVKQTANQQHPMTQFSVGNLNTLSDTDNSSILEDVKTQYKTYYSADIMSLAIIGNYPMDSLAQMAEGKFGAIESKGNTRTRERPAPYLPEQQGVKIYVKTLDEDYSVRVTFALPAAWEHYRTKPVSFIANQYRNKSKGSLYETLKTLGWLKYYGVLTWGPDDFSRLQINIGLTKEGYQNVDEVIDYLFSYTTIIRDTAITKERYDELAQTEHLKFEYRDKARVSRAANNLSRNLQYYPPQHVLDIGRTFYDFDADLIKKFMADMTPQKARIIISGPDIISDIKEERYDVPYFMEPIDAAQLRAWSLPSKRDALSLPDANRFMPEDLSLTSEVKAVESKLAFDGPGINLWYTNANEFALPKAALNIRFYTENAFDSPAHQAVIALHVRMIKDALSEENYNLRQAGLSYGVGSSVRSYNFSIRGYNDKMDRLFQDILTAFDVSALDETVFERVKQSALQDLRNQKFARPMRQVYNEVSVESHHIVLGNVERIALLETLTFQEFRSVVENLQARMQVEGVLNGNVTRSDVDGIGQLITSAFGSRLKSGSKLEFVETVLAPGSAKIRELAVDHNDSTLFALIQGDEDSDEDIAMFKLLAHILSPKFYASLRTEQQLGYVVQLTDFSYDRIPALFMFVQSPKAHPVQILDAMNKFLQSQEDYLANLNEDDFQKSKEGLLSNINKKYDNVSAKSADLNRQIVAGELTFDRRARLSKAVESISLQELQAFYKKEILSPSRRFGGIWSIGKAHKDYFGYSPAVYDICYVSKCLHNADLP